ncbi:GCN5-related N-acetyltransferase [Phocaeicola salanitronis DSM 18170]|uniref:GCN5-related N-acetyltransferase n=2 Tax=Phocaeicola salanitronis TaxID=376805 RepID=F0R2V6_PHOSB|nr:GCN5-related N-acetyltransferase [Phocaeicola salanitronis DSM 18170]
MTTYHFAQNEQEVKQMNIRFEPVPRNEFGDFKKDVKEIFAIGIIEHFGMPDDGEPVPDRDVDEALYHPNADVFYVYQDNRRVGGVVLTIDKETHRNKMDLFYIYPDCHSRGLGYAVWKQIESMYPETKVWELVTPCFEKRNIHFYVNKCGFHIVEYFNARHKDPDYPDSGYEYRAEYFRFEKLMKP